MPVTTTTWAKRLTDRKVGFNKMKHGPRKRPVSLNRPDTNYQVKGAKLGFAPHYLLALKLVACASPATG
jgi:hypothetical protein